MTAPNRRRLLLDAARHLFGTRPYEAVTTTEVARAAGVAYGLIAHHFGNKRGLYLAVLADLRAELAAVHDVSPAGGGPLDLLREALRRHVDYIDDRRESFRALLRGGLGADPAVQTLIDELRWDGVRRILREAGVEGEPSRLLGAVMRSWVVLLDELMLDRIEGRQISAEEIVDVASSALVALLRTTMDLDPTIRLSPAVEQMVTGATGR